MGRLYDNYTCASTLSVELLAIQKAYMAVNNFPYCNIWVENDCKTTVEALLGISLCPCRAILLFGIVLSLVSKINNAKVF